MNLKKILVLGAGRSSSACISYLIDNASANDWQITVGNYTESEAKERIGTSANAVAIPFNIDNTEASRDAISKADVVISLVPASFHPLVATLCLTEKKHLLTASLSASDPQETSRPRRTPAIP